MASDHGAGGPARVLFTTERSSRHQQLAIEAAPDSLHVVMLKDPSRRALVSHLPDTRFLVSERVGVVDADLLSAAPNLELILRIGSFIHDIDLDAAKKAGVIVCRWPLSGAMRAAEHVVLQMLALTKRLRSAESAILGSSDPQSAQSRRSDENTFAFNWSKIQGLDSLVGKTIGTLGFGEIGAELARRLQGWGCTLCYHKRRRLPESVEFDLGVSYTGRDSVIAGSDIVVNLLPYSAETDMMIDAGKMADGAYLVSCGSGATLDEAAAAQAIERGSLAGLALDTFEWEPIKAGNRLIQLANSGQNIVLTPHIAGGDRAAAAAERQGYYTNITNHLTGRPLHYRLA